MLDDQAIPDPIENHQVTRNALARRRHSGKFALVNPAERRAHRNKIPLGNDLVRDELIQRKRRLGDQDVLFQPGVVQVAVQQLVRFRLPAQCFKIVLDQLLRLLFGFSGRHGLHLLLLRNDNAAIVSQVRPLQIPGSCSKNQTKIKRCRMEPTSSANFRYRPPSGDWYATASVSICPPRPLTLSTCSFAVTNALYPATKSSPLSGPASTFLKPI